MRREFAGPPLGWSLIIAVGGLGAYVFYELLVWRSPSTAHLHSWAAGAGLAGALLISEVVVGALVPGFPNFLFGVALVAGTYVLFSLGTWAPTYVRAIISSTVAFGLILVVYRLARARHDAAHNDASKRGSGKVNESGTKKIEATLVVAGIVALILGFLCDFRAGRVEAQDRQDRCMQLSNHDVSLSKPLQKALERVACER